ncbi:MAG: hypothetical protein A2430_00200 [Candidatus Liptonbacteria bacterium RIFOXYC1_FULL_36_8]|uniref:Prepilin-type N-terminal cleavage/methylation domain-containing protein n=3 Tax=Candidatus Liptoniibacteriota TaxID=1817909 RepID=A0A1G2CNL3_9BACT|nr:MAG: hypothetical protein A2390_01200 [Candidatus Liptonbacteria bacterium RIFOXYB1_FULL_36_10]OGZ03031.1 MAG: hypothetical protein A2604_00965 [Candidatus Liptonbacteria bacterium RIFOXYD1_FULL_36_11]OGZ03056.1 MAG: hypothetical protein A2430_00200 [Candidatus Liptonbacteria bacterium RIFOXYC1_FULL_36_8]
MKIIEIKKRDREEGFTIVEVLVAIAMFSVILSVAMGSYLRILKNQGFLTAVMAANDNVSLAVEQMVRDIRTGTGFSVIDSGGGLIFKSDTGNCVKYWLYSESSSKSSLNFSSFNGDCSNAVFSGEKVTSDKVKVDELLFTLKSETSGGASFDTIGINMKISVSEKGMDYENEINTDVSPRKYFGG